MDWNGSVGCPSYVLLASSKSLQIWLDLEINYQNNLHQLIFCSQPVLHEVDLSQPYLGPGDNKLLKLTTFVTSNEKLQPPSLGSPQVTTLYKSTKVSIVSGSNAVHPMWFTYRQTLYIYGIKYYPAYILEADLSPSIIISIQIHLYLKEYWLFQHWEPCGSIFLYGSESSTCGKQLHHGIFKLVLYIRTSDKWKKKRITPMGWKCMVCMYIYCVPTFGWFAKYTIMESMGNRVRST